MTGLAVVLVTTFLASSVEAIEMVTVVLGVGATRGWRSTLFGAGTGTLVLVVVSAILGVALAAIPIAALRVVVGTLLLLFGLQWYRKGIVRVAARGLAGYESHEHEEEPIPETGLDWTAFVLSLKAVVLEGLEVAFIVVTFGATAGHLVPAIFAGVAAVLAIAAVGFAVRSLVARIPRSLLQLIVGTLLTSFGTFWSLEGLGVRWPQEDLDIVALLLVYTVSALTYIVFERGVSRRQVRVAA